MIMIQLLLILALVILLATQCRKTNPKLEALKGWAYAHRGLHGSGLPENSLSAFKAAMDGGYGVELDVHLLKDGNLAVIHDSLLNRTTGRPGNIEDLATDDLKDYFLEGTGETIPELMEVLTLFAGRVPMIVELKPENGNHAALAEVACDMMRDYKGPYCIESFDPRCIAWVKKNRPNLVRGQLTENFMKTRSDLSVYIKFLLTHNLLNFTTVPDFIAYKFADRNDSPMTALCRKVWGVQGVSWTLKTRQEYDTAVKEGWIPIFEGFLPPTNRLTD